MYCTMLLYNIIISVNIIAHCINITRVIKICVTIYVTRVILFCLSSRTNCPNILTEITILFNYPSVSNKGRKIFLDRREMRKRRTSNERIGNAGQPRLSKSV